MVKFFGLIGVLFVSSAFGQSFNNVRVLREEEKIVIIYDLVYEEAGSKVIVSLFGSHNNFESPITRATGDLGEVQPGPNRRIEWIPGNSIKKYSGNLTFQFKGEIIHGWKFLDLDKGSLRRGKDYLIKWQGGRPTDTVTLQMISPSQKIIEIGKTKNTGSFYWTVPKIKTGTGYALKLSKGEEVFEHRITIKRKIPLIIWAVPITGAIFLGIGNSDNGGSGNLPEAPKPH